MRTWTFKLTVEEGNDEYWEEKPSTEILINDIVDTLHSQGFLDVELKLMKYVETVEDQ